MAKQSGIFPIEGTIGDITFFKSKEGFQVRRKGGISAGRMATDPAFQRTRENMAEFGRAGKAGKLFRTALRSLATDCSDSKAVGRLAKAFLKVIQADTAHNRGERTVSGGDPALLTGFEFNSKGTLSTSLLTPYTATVDKTAGSATIAITAFSPTRMLAVPGGSTHFKIVSCVAVMDFDTDVSTTAGNETAEMAISDTATTISLTHSIAAGTTQPVFVLLGIQFLQSVNSAYYPLKNGSYNALAIVKVA